MEKLLLNNFFYINEKESPEDSFISFDLSFNPDHGIFNGHFPEQAIVPGVCMIQLIGELLSQEFGAEYILKESKNIKFLNLLIPKEKERTLLLLKIREREANHVNIEAVMKNDTTTFLKLKGIFASA